MACDVEGLSNSSGSLPICSASCSITASDGLRSARLQVALLDDWSLSGRQAETARFQIESENPEVTGRLEVHQAIATSRRTAIGLERNEADLSDLSTPVVAYYEARPSTNMTTKTKCHITGYHSSTNFGSEYALKKIVSDARANGASDAILQTLPPLANIVRPYRSEEGTVLKNIERLNYYQNPTNQASIWLGDEGCEK